MFQDYSLLQIEINRKWHKKHKQIIHNTLKEILALLTFILYHFESFLSIFRDIEEFLHDEIHIYLCSQEQASDDKLQAEKHGGLKGYSLTLNLSHTILY